MYLWSDNAYQDVNLVQADGTRIYYVRISPGEGQEDAVYEHTATPTQFYKSKIAWNGNGWDLTLKNGTVYVFDINQRLIEIRDRYGNKLKIWRYIAGRITKITTSSNKWINFTYDAYGRITQLKDVLGRTVNYTYDVPGSGGRLWKVTDPMNGVTEYTYDTSHRMLTIKNPRGYFYVTNEYDGNGRIFRQTRADSTTFQFSYTLDGNGKVIQSDVTNPRGYVRRRTYNSDGYILTDTGAFGTAVQQTITNEWQTGTNLLLSVTDALGRKTSFTYDTMGNTISITRLAGTGQAVTTTFGYEAVFNQLNSITDPLNHITSITYDGSGNPTTIADPLNNQASFTYNSSGQPLTVTDPMTNVTQFSYTLGSLTNMTLPMNRMVSEFVDIGGRPIQSTNPAGQSEYVEYDNMNRILKLTDTFLGVTLFSYDANSNLLNVTDPRNKINAYSYDVMDHLVTRTDPLQHTENYLYDNNGNLMRITDRKSQITNYTYDPLDRLTQIQFHDGSTTTFTYDLGNRVTQVVDSTSGSITLTHDNLNRLTSQSTSQGSVSYTYDNANRRASMTIGGQPIINYSYDNADRLTQITQGAATVVIAYDAAGRRTSVTLPNNTKMEYTYNAASQVTEIVYKQGVNVIGNLTYEYDVSGRRTKVGGSFARINLPAALVSATYNDANQQATFGGQALTYDNNGNLTNDGVNSYTWNTRDQLISTSGPGLNATFQYDALGRRINKTINGASTSFLYDGLNPVQELSGGTPTANLLTGLSLDEYFRRTDASSTRYFFTDGLGSTVGLTDSNGVIQTEYKYEAFGGTTTSGASNSNSYQYIGRENDGTGLYYYRARYYSSKLQRFLSEDPIGLGSGNVNFYAFVSNNPSNLIDPLGLCDCDERDPTNKKILDFMRAHLADAQLIADELSIPVEFILGLSAEESTWGTSNIATKFSNFFGMHGGAKYSVGTYHLSKKVSVSIYPIDEGYLISGLSFGARWGKQLSGVSDAADFVQRLEDACFNGCPAQNPRFKKLLKDTIDSVKKRLVCLQ